MRLGCSLPRSVAAHWYFLPPMPDSRPMNIPMTPDITLIIIMSGMRARKSAVTVATVALTLSPVASSGVSATGAAATRCDTRLGVAKTIEIRSSETRSARFIRFILHLPSRGQGNKRRGRVKGERPHGLNPKDHSCHGRRAHKPGTNDADVLW